MDDFETGISIQMPSRKLSYQATLRREATVCNKQWAGGRATVPWWCFATPEVYHDPPMNDEAWVRHHSWTRHLFRPKQFFLTIYGMWPVLLWLTAFATGVSVYQYYSVSYPERNLPVLVNQGYLQVYALASLALSLLLVFRANNSYNRW